MPQSAHADVAAAILGWPLKNVSIGWNAIPISASAHWRGRSLPEEHRANISAWNRKRFLDAAEIHKISAALIGRQKRQFSKEHRAKIAAAGRGRVAWNRGTLWSIPWNKGTPGSQVPWNKGKRLTEKQRANIGSGWRGRKNQEHSARLQGRKNPEHSARLTGRALSPEHRHKISIAHKCLNRSPEHSAHLAAALRGHTVSPQTRAKISTSLRERAAARRRQEGLCASQ